MNLNPFSVILTTFDADRFFDRERDVLPILIGVSGTHQTSFALQGERTVGVSTLLRYLVAEDGARKRFADEYKSQLEGAGYSLRFILIDCVNMAGDDVLARIARELLDVLEPGGQPGPMSQGPSAAMTAAAADARSPRQVILDRLASARRQRLRPVICLDHFDEAFTSMLIEDDRFLRSMLPDIALVVATEKPMALLRRDRQTPSPLVGALLPRVIGLLDEQGVKRLLTEPIGDARLAFSAPEMTFLRGAAGRHPYLLTVCAEYLYALKAQLEDAGYEGRQAHTVEDAAAKRRIRQTFLELPTVNELFERVWSRLSTAERGLLSRLAAPLSEQPDERDDTPWAMLAEAERPTFNTLRRRSLVEEDLLHGGVRIYSWLFAKFMAQKTPAGVPSPAAPAGMARDISPQDRRILDYLQRFAERECTFEEIYEAVWAGQPAKRALEGAIYRLRQHLADLPDEPRPRIRSVRGRGFQYLSK